MIEAYILEAYNSIYGSMLFYLGPKVTTIVVATVMALSFILFLVVGGYLRSCIQDKDWGFYP